MSASYVCGSAATLRNLSPEDRARLDREPWVFALNKHLSHWREAGFRPSVWAWGDTERPVHVTELREQLAALAEDPELVGRPSWCFVGLAEERRLAELAVREFGLENRIRFYRRQAPWAWPQAPVDSLGNLLYHTGSSLADLANMAGILNPGQPIKLLGCPCDDSYEHFWTAAPRHAPDVAFWREVKARLWQGLAALVEQHGYTIFDCNGTEAPASVRSWIPTAPLFENENGIAQ
ncbi:MAG: hypothetical protein IMZ55_12315 [Acidobacteria bacterium]|nr:hypothetical protein [Acidobacteriota bacterium]